MPLLMTISLLTKMIGLGRSERRVSHFATQLLDHPLKGSILTRGFASIAISTVIAFILIGHIDLSDLIIEVRITLIVWFTVSLLFIIGTILNIFDTIRSNNRKKLNFMTPS